MHYCTHCVLPDTRPGLVIGPDGVCNACRAHEAKPAVDWNNRREAFAALAEEARRSHEGYDCLIPVSGGKDSTWQTLTCLEYGLTPLCVTWRTPGRTALGQKNLENLIALGVDHVDYTINPETERRFMLASLSRFGTPAIPMHLALFNVPLTLAAKLEIPLVVYGENGALEYGGEKEEAGSFRLTQKWMDVHGVTHGTTAADWVGPGLSRKALTPFFGPGVDALASQGTMAIFLGHYFGWDPQKSLAAALAHGFTPRAEGPKTGYYNYADIDDDFIAIHHWLKWYKFGFTRLFDNLSLEIRHGRLSREEALAILAATGPQTPHEDIARFCAFTRISPAQFHEMARRWRNPAIWHEQNGKWRIPGFLVDNWPWEDT